MPEEKRTCQPGVRKTKTNFNEYSRKELIQKAIDDGLVQHAYQVKYKTKADLCSMLKLRDPFATAFDETRIVMPCMFLI
jgi:hypothetical protein